MTYPTELLAKAKFELGVFDRVSAETAVELIEEIERLSEWKTMESAPKDKPILAWCVHEANPWTLDDCLTLTTYAAHTEGLSHVQDGANIVVWGGEYREGDWENGHNIYIPDWWFLSDSDFEIVANPVLWKPIDVPDNLPETTDTQAR